MKRFRYLFVLAAAAAIPAVMHSAPLVPIAPSGAPLVLKGGTVHPVTSAPLPNSDLLIENGRIAAIGARLAVPTNARVIDVAGRHVYPGLIAANTSLGVHEISSIIATRDVAETGQINPNARAQVAVNPDNSHLGVTRLNGVLTALVMPANQSPGTAAPALIAGQSALIRLEGGRGKR